MQRLGRRRKLLEAFPDSVRARAALGSRRFRFVPPLVIDDDPRLRALADAVREQRIVRIRAGAPAERVIHPIGLVCNPSGWSVEDQMTPEAPISLDDCGDINISSKTFVRA